MKKEKGSALILAVILLGIFAIMATAFVVITNSQRKNYNWSKQINQHPK